MSRAIDALVDGVRSDLIAIDDRGLLYGHGMFETCRIVDRCVPLWSYHRARLSSAALRLRIVLDIKSIDAEVADLAATQRIGVIKVLITAGPGRGYRSSTGPVRRVISVFPLHDAPQGRDTRMTVRICDTRLSVQPALAGMKHLNRLEQVMACNEWSDSAIAEGLMCDSEGRLIEGTSTNLFLVHDGCIVTAALDRCGVAGVMRQVLIDERPGIGVPIEVRDIALDELDSAEECFLTNAVIGIRSVSRVLDRVGAWPQTGRITLRIATALEARFGFPVSV
jgi:4-amino-4-deoxychorismate lyase